MQSDQNVSAGQVLFEMQRTITTLQAELAEARQANDTALAMAMQAGADAERERIVDWLRSPSGDWPLATAHAELLATTIEARDWSKP